MYDLQKIRNILNSIYYKFEYFYTYCFLGKSIS